jgi:hypothetical protein
VAVGEAYRVRDHRAGRHDAEMSHNLTGTRVDNLQTQVGAPEGAGNSDGAEHPAAFVA